MIITDETGKEVPKCSMDMYLDDRGDSFCPDCVLKEIEPGFLVENLDAPGELRLGRGKNCAGEGISPADV
jgi:hypothetical protein